MDDFTLEDTYVTRNNLVTVICLLTQTLLDLNTLSIIDEDCALGKNLLNALEHIFYHGLKLDASNRRPTKHPWPILFSYADADPTGCITSATIVCNSGDFSKLRSWIKISLVKRCLSQNLDFAKQLLCSKNLYSKDALLLSGGYDEVLVGIRALDAVKFNFDLKNDRDSSDFLHPIDYTPFLNRFNSYIPNQLLAPLEPELSEPSPSDWRTKLIELETSRKCILNRQEELEKAVQLKDGIIKTELAELNSCRACLRDMESQVLELQVQVTLYYEECVKHLQAAGIKSQIHPPPTLKQWRERSRRRRNLILRTEAGRYRSPFDNTTTHTPMSSAIFSTVNDVDQGIDALDYYCKTADASTSCDYSKPCDGQTQNSNAHASLANSQEVINQTHPSILSSQSSHPLSESPKRSSVSHGEKPTPKPTERFALQQMSNTCSHLVLPATSNNRSASTTDRSPSLYKSSNDSGMKLASPYAASTPSGLTHLHLFEEKRPSTAHGSHIQIDERENPRRFFSAGHSTLEVCQRPGKLSFQQSPGLLDSLISEDQPDASPDREPKMLDLLSRKYYHLMSPSEEEAAELVSSSFQTASEDPASVEPTKPQGEC